MGFGKVKLLALVAMSLVLIWQASRAIFFSNDTGKIQHLSSNRTKSSDDGRHSVSETTEMQPTTMDQRHGIEYYDLPKDLDKDQMSGFLWQGGAGTVSVARQNAVWNWLKSNGASPYYREIISELMGTVPYNIMPEVIEAFPGMSTDVKRDLLISFAGILDALDRDVEGHDTKAMESLRRDLTKLVEMQIYTDPSLAAFAYDALLRDPVGVDEEVSSRVFNHLLKLPAEEIDRIYPTTEVASEPKTFWARRIAVYSQSLTTDQSKAVSSIIEMFPTLADSEKDEISNVFLRAIQSHEIRERANGENGNSESEGTDQELTEESYKLLVSKLEMLRSRSQATRPR